MGRAHLPVVALASGLLAADAAAEGPADVQLFEQPGPMSQPAAVLQLALLQRWHRGLVMVSDYGAAESFDDAPCLVGDLCSLKQTSD